MGYSCTTAAAMTLRKIHDGEDGGFLRVGGERYFLERGQENEDGAVTGSVRRIVRQEGDAFWSRRVGGFRIGPEGDLELGPEWLRKLLIDSSAGTIPPQEGGS